MMMTACRLSTGLGAEEQADVAEQPANANVDTLSDESMDVTVALPAVNVKV